MSTKLPFSAPVSEVTFAIEAITKASRAVLQVYGEEFTPELKEDDSPVTKADLQSNEIIKKVLSPHVCQSYQKKTRTTSPA